jgi:hypothetical protein
MGAIRFCVSNVGRDLAATRWAAQAIELILGAPQREIVNMTGRLANACVWAQSHSNRAITAAIGNDGLAGPDTGAARTAHPRRRRRTQLAKHK